ncbi:hypothetical protein ACSQ67_024826 [Phaseolus vulgaris]
MRALGDYRRVIAVIGDYRAEVIVGSSYRAGYRCRRMLAKELVIFRDASGGVVADLSQSTRRHRARLSRMPGMPAAGLPGGLSWVRALATLAGRKVSSGSGRDDAKQLSWQQVRAGDFFVKTAVRLSLAFSVWRYRWVDFIKQEVIEVGYRRDLSQKLSSAGLSRRVIRRCSNIVDLSTVIRVCYRMVIGDLSWERQHRQRKIGETGDFTVGEVIVGDISTGYLGRGYRMLSSRGPQVNIGMFTGWLLRLSAKALAKILSVCFFAEAAGDVIVREVIAVIYQSRSLSPVSGRLTRELFAEVISVRLYRARLSRYRGSGLSCGEVIAGVLLREVGIGVTLSRDYRAEITLVSLSGKVIAGDFIVVIGCYRGEVIVGGVYRGEVIEVRLSWVILSWVILSMRVRLSGSDSLSCRGVGLSWVTLSWVRLSWVRLSWVRSVVVLGVIVGEVIVGDFIVGEVIVGVGLSSGEVIGLDGGDFIVGEVIWVRLSCGVTVILSWVRLSRVIAGEDHAVILSWVILSWWGGSIVGDFIVGEVLVVGAQEVIAVVLSRVIVGDFIAIAVSLSWVSLSWVSKRRLSWVTLSWRGYRVRLSRARLSRGDFIVGEFYRWVRLSVTIVGEVIVAKVIVGEVIMGDFIAGDFIVARLSWVTLSRLSWVRLSVITVIGDFIVGEVIVGEVIVGDFIVGEEVIVGEFIGEVIVA